MGSRIEVHTMQLDSYPNAGMGDPCAGHVKAMEVPETSSKERVLDLDANFGFALPTGSAHSVQEKFLLKKIVPEGWNGAPLSWAGQGHGSTRDVFKR